MVTKSTTSKQLICEMANNWYTYSVEVKLAILWVVARRRYRNMSRNRKIAVVVIAVLAAIFFLVLSASMLGAMPLAQRMTLWAFALGLLVGAVVVWAITR